MTVFHIQPSATLDWEDNYQVDDRPGMMFKGQGGILDRIEFYGGTDQGATTDGAYLVRVYKAGALAEGVDPVPDAWAASTAYTVGDLVHPTSTANADVHYVYRCTVGGTSGGSEPSWPSFTNSWQDNAEGDTIVDNTVTWEVVWTGYPENPALPADTPTPDWIAQSDTVAYAPGTNELAWRTVNFTGADRIRLQHDQWYVAVVQWHANSSDVNNLLAVHGGNFADADHEGVCYLDGSSVNNNGPRIIEDLYFKLYETKTTLDKLSGTDTGFDNVDTPADTDPFNSGDQVGYTVQAGEALDDGTYWWKVRVTDPAGTGLWSSYTEVRDFSVQEGLGRVLELDLAQSLSALKARAIGQVAEAEVSQALSTLKLRSLSQVVETDLAQPFDVANIQDIGRVIETDLVQTLSPIKIKTIGSIAEINTAQPLGTSRARMIGQAAEASIARALSSLKSISLDQVTEIELAQPLSVGGPTQYVIGRVIEADTALAMSSQKARSLGQVVETTLAQGFSARKYSLIGQIVQAEIAQSLVALKLRGVSQASEAELAQSLTPMRLIDIGQVTETDQAQTLLAQKTLQLGQTTETDIALHIYADGTLPIGIVIAEFAVRLPSITSAGRGPSTSGTGRKPGVEASGA